MGPLLSHPIANPQIDAQQRDVGTEGRKVEPTFVRIYTVFEHDLLGVRLIDKNHCQSIAQWYMNWKMALLAVAFVTFLICYSLCIIFLKGRVHIQYSIYVSINLLVLVSTCTLQATMTNVRYAFTLCVCADLG